MVDFIEFPKKANKEEIEVFEKKYKIVLPEQYKSFLINVGFGEIKCCLDGLEYYYYDKENNLYEFNRFLSLDDIYEENITWGNKKPLKSSLLLFAQLYNNCFYCIFIDKNSRDYGKIYYILSGYHPTFEYLMKNKNHYKKLPLLENTFDDFISNIKKEI